MVKEFMINDKIGGKKAKGRVYDFIIKQVPGIKCKNLCKQTQKALKIYNLFEKIGINKIQHIKPIARILFQGLLIYRFRLLLIILLKSLT